jgi:1,2-phenylacetyl-CoA epoxidase PaaB subunit
MMAGLGGPYEVFARSRRGEPLRHVGCVQAPSDALARLYARWVYDEERWNELAVVRREHLLRVEGGPVAGTAPAAGRPGGASG